MRQTSETSKIRRWTHRGRQRSSGHLLDDCSRIANWRPEDGSAVRAYFRSSLGGWLGRSTGQLSHVDRRISHEVARNDVTSVLSRLRYGRCCLREKQASRKQNKSCKKCDGRTTIIRNNVNFHRSLCLFSQESELIRQRQSFSHRKSNGNVSFVGPSQDWITSNMEAIGTESNSLGPVEAPSDKLWGDANSGWKCPPPPPRNLYEIVHGSRS